jgi:hypothetical protein
MNRKGVNVPGMPKTKWIASWVGGEEIPSMTPTPSITPTLTPTPTPSITPSSLPPEPPLNCCIYDVYTGATLEDVCIDCNTTYMNIYADAVLCNNILSNKMKDNCGGTPLPNDIYFYFDGDPTTIYKTTGGDGTIIVETCPTYNIETQDGDDIITEDGDNIVWTEPECIAPSPTPSMTPTSSITPTPSITPTNTQTPTPSITPSSSPPLISGCTDPEACNFDPEASIDDGSCVYPGCTDPEACNFDAEAGCDDGSCVYPGCIDPEACNFDAEAGCDDGSCVYPGCTDPEAINYDPEAGCDDGSCIYE